MLLIVLNPALKCGRTKKRYQSKEYLNLNWTISKECRNMFKLFLPCRPLMKKDLLLFYRFRVE